MSDDSRNVYLMSETYDCEDIDGQHPVSRDDVDIIRLIAKVLEDTGTDEDLAGIISSWKTLATDSQIKDDLEEYLKKGAKGDGEYKNKVFKDLVDINGVCIDIKYLSIIDKVETYDSGRKRMEYGIRINKDSTDTLFFSNTVVDCGSRDNREKILSEIKEKLNKYTTIRFL